MEWSGRRRLSMVAIPLVATLLASCGGTGGAPDGGNPPPGGGGPPPPGGSDTLQPFPIDRGGTSGAPATYKTLPLALTASAEPAVTPVGGVIGVVCIGMSNARAECDRFILRMDRGEFPGVASAVRFVNCAVDGYAIERWIDPADDAVTWDACVNQRLPARGITRDQVRVIWHKAADINVTANGAVLPPYPDQNSDYFHFYDNLTTFAGRVGVKFPAVRAVYTTSRSYGGFSGTPDRGEPLSYEQGHALNQWLARFPDFSGVWFGWGPYIWAPDCTSGSTNGSGLCYDRADFRVDGYHPSTSGQDKVADLLHARFSQHAWYRQ